LDASGSFFVNWKKSGFANPRRVGDRALSFQVNMQDRNQADFDPQTSDYVAFLIFSRTECGQPFIRDLESVQFDVFQKDTEVIYGNYNGYLRWDGDSARRSYTMQFSRLLNGGTDAKSNAKKDMAWITMSGFSDAVMDLVKTDALTDNCLNKVQVGVLVLNDEIDPTDPNHARCVGEQKLVGF